MKKIILLVYIVYCTINVYAQNITDTTNVIHLKEVEIKADKIISKGEYQVLLLSKENRDFGTNALDAVSSLSFFETSLNETKLISWDKQEVFILVNGVPATGYDLRSYKGSDIKNVRYYPVAPVEYMSYTEGPVIDVIVKKRHDRLYAGYINLLNAVNTGFGTDQANIMYRDSLNQVSVGYVADYRNLKDIKNFTEYTFNDSRSAYSENENYKGFYHNINASYQRYQNSHLFNAKLTYMVSPLKEYGDTKTELLSDDILKEYSGTKLLDTKTNAFSVDLYYKYLIDRQKAISINVVNTFGKSYTLSEQNTDLNTVQDYHSRTDNKTYSLIANAAYGMPLLKGSFRASAYYMYKTLTQDFAERTVKPISHNLSFQSALYWKVKSWTIYPAVEFKYVKQTSGNRQNNSFAPNFRFYTDWWGKGATKGLTFQFTGMFTQINPGLSDITDSYSYIESYLISTGNPLLKNYWRNYGKFLFAYIAPNSKNNIRLIFTPTYYRDIFLPCVIEQDGINYFKPMNIRNKFDNHILLMANINPIKWLEIFAYTEYIHTNFNTIGQHINLNQVRLGGGITISLDKFTGILSYNDPTKDYDGDFLNRSSAQWGMEAQYKIKTFSVGFKYSYSSHNDYKLFDVNRVKYYSVSDKKILHNLFRLSVTYTFSVGKARQHDKKNVSNSDNEMGLGRYNTPEKL